MLKGNKLILRNIFIYVQKFLPIESISLQTSSQTLVAFVPYNSAKFARLTFKFQDGTQGANEESILKNVIVEIRSICHGRDPT